MDEEEDNNQGVIFVEIEGTLLQVRKQKKSKKTQEPKQPPANLCRPVTCSLCRQQGHNKRKCLSPGKAG